MIDTERAVERLTAAHTEHTEAGPVEWPPLLEWLERSVTEVVKRGMPGGKGAGIPIDFEALRLLNTIKKEVRVLRASVFMFGKAPNVIEAVKELWKTLQDDRKKGRVDDSEWDYACETINGWVESIVAEQAARPRKMELTVPCPRCGSRWVQETDEHGELNPDAPREAAITIEYGEDRAPVAECRMAECQAIWAGWDQVAQLGLTVQADMDLAVLDACGIKIGVG